MAYVTIPKDLSKVKNKVFLNLTKRQLVCMGFAAGIGVPFYFLMRDTLGTSNAAAGMVLLMLPEFFFALYEKNGMHLETILTNFISVRFKRPAVRRYEIENLYDRELETAAPIQKKGGMHPGITAPPSRARTITKPIRRRASRRMRLRNRMQSRRPRKDDFPLRMKKAALSVA